MELVTLFNNEMVMVEEASKVILLSWEVSVGFDVWLEIHKGSTIASPSANVKPICGATTTLAVTSVTSTPDNGTAGVSLETQMSG